ncbi:hypothetical protein [Actinomadura livida]|uniref:ABC transporter substrate-binding protein n=1 Tax=Actinomadura livida TaxID=79909 RepID=A0A7W7IBQ6_9ACTN|nr:MULTISPECIES: hypothetical protein [Actinomadura]MBB4774014.1 hypothetical protein [Actinomadura catellatispora]GGT85479.1 hypothetical protein GCM10010208_05450 [Actinomadura livida]
MRRVLTGLSAIAVALLTVLALTAAPASAREAAAPAPLDSVPVTGTADDGSTFTGTVTPTAFTSQDRRLLLNGTLDGTMRDASGATTGTVTDQAVALPVGLPSASCPILDLTLGPLDLDLLGLTVHLDRVVLDITAVSGPGKLLGNLLCAIAGILDGPGDLGLLPALLAQLNALLGLGR